MTCYSTVKTPAQVEARKDTLKELAEALTSGRLKITRNAKGELSIPAWAETAAAKTWKWCEGCALRALQTQGSWLVKSTLAKQGVGAKPFNTVGHGHGH